MQSKFEFVRFALQSNSIGWFLSSITLAVFPLLPPVGRVANYDYVWVVLGYRELFWVDSSSILKNSDLNWYVK